MMFFTQEFKSIPHEKSIILIPLYSSKAGLELCKQVEHELKESLQDYQLGSLDPILMTVRAKADPVLPSVTQIRAHVLRDYLIDLCRNFSDQGYFHFVCVCPDLDPKTLTAIEEASRSLSSRGSSWVKKGFDRLRKIRKPILLSLSGGLYTQDKVGKELKDIFTSSEIKNCIPHLKMAFDKNERSSAFTTFYYYNPLHRSLLSVWILVALLSLILTVWIYGALSGWLGDVG
jgi:hypothetical protein